MNDFQSKQKIFKAIRHFDKGSLKKNATSFLNMLGYGGDRGSAIEIDGPEHFLEQFDREEKLRRDKALFEDWECIEVLFQLTDEDINQSEQLGLFESSEKAIDNKIIQSFLFLAMELQDREYSRTKLSSITREVNKLTLQPAIILFQHGDTLTLSVIARRLHKRDSSKDVLEKVTLIKDISIAEPHRAHVEILFELSLNQLFQKYRVTNFVELYDAWQKTLDISELNKRFYKELADWYFWAVDRVTFPEGAGDDEETRNATSVIRLITRLIFIWFIKEKGLVPENLFDKAKLNEILDFGEPNESRYYKAILQNLFFATLNTEMNTEHKTNREFRGTRKSGRDQHYMSHSLYRYERYFKDPDIFLEMVEDIPFLNGGLFECLDKRDEQGNAIRIDGFSDRSDNPISVPDYLFFGEEREVDLNKAYGTKNKRYKVRGLINILKSYKFTVEENTPIEEEIALDPELLGRVFENLLASYNPETGTTARKQTGSFYTPREIVNYMVDESLIAYLESQLNASDDERLRELFAYTDEPHRFSDTEVDELISAIDNIKILDPACGSGAFPMGVLHKLVFILGKLDPHNQRWKAKQISRAYEIPDSTIREKAISDIEEAFERNELDYGRKLYLIENAIFGVDIQPIAVQISKLRCFISLIVDQKIDDTQPNRGILPLPNLATKFVAANTLIGIDKNKQQNFQIPKIKKLEEELGKVRRDHFTARTTRTKNRCRERDRKIRREISEVLKSGGFPSDTAEKLANWDPYDQNASSDFFDSEWMFGVRDGFDVVIGNPPYGGSYDKSLKSYFRKRYESAKTIKGISRGSLDTFSLFTDLALQITNNNAVLAYILPMAITSSDSVSSLHKLIFRICETIYISSFAVRPKKIFDNADVNTSILICHKKNKPVENIFTTRMYKRYAADTTVQQIIDNLQYVEASPFVKYGRIPKIGLQIEVDILRKLFAVNTTVADLKQEEGSPVYYRYSGGRYYKIITNFPTGSSAEKCFYVKNDLQNLVGAILSSSLFFWFYHIYSDNYNLKTYELDMFPIPIDNFTKPEKRKIEQLYAEYLLDLDRNSKVKKVNYKHVKSYKEYYARYSKHLIDKIDLAIKSPYGLTDEEINFIINYDLKFRTDG